MRVIYILFIGLLVLGCAQKEASYEGDQNPAAAGFDVSGSDPAAIELADSIMQAMGGRKNWDNTRYISWNSAGRSIIYDRQSERVRIVQGDTICLLTDGTGRMQINGNEVDDPAVLNPALQKIRETWRMDLHDLLLPLILKGEGVTLRYMGEDSMSGQRFNSLILTFQQSPDQYKLYVDKHSKLVRFGAYYPMAGTELDKTIHPWDNYQEVEQILVSANRSDGFGPKSVKLDKELRETLFTEF